MGLTGIGLRTWREDNGYTQSELAIALNMHIRDIVNWEKEIKPVLPQFLMNRLNYLQRTPQQVAQINQMRQQQQQQQDNL